MAQAELHVHIEGTLEPQLMFDLAVRNDVLHLLPYKSAAEAKAAYNFHNLQSFLDLYYAGCAVLLTKQVILTSRALPSTHAGGSCNQF